MEWNAVKDWLEAITHSINQSISMVEKSPPRSSMLLLRMVAFIPYLCSGYMDVPLMIAVIGIGTGIGTGQSYSTFNIQHTQPGGWRKSTSPHLLSHPFP